MTEADEVLGIVQRIGPVVMSSARDATGTAAALLRRTVGMMLADYNMVHLQTFCVVFGQCLDLARQCGATIVTMDRVRRRVLEEAPVHLPGIQTVLAVVRLTLACDARIIAAMTFRSRDEVDTIAARINEAFSQTSVIAADEHDAGTYMAIIRLHGDLVKHLADRGRQLPRIVGYQYQVALPALRIAQMSYSDPSRSRELIDENDVVHPAFMPMTGKMLAV